jgi:hypothetical protein
LVTFADEFEFLILLIEDFEEESPSELFESLGSPGDASILPHGGGKVSVPITLCFPTHE